MSQVKWLPEALADIARLYRFLHDNSPEAAARAAQAILDGATILVTMPDIGRPFDDDSGRREWLIAFSAGFYVLRYRRNGDNVVIIRVWHSREGG